jgi:hypothetical protein
MSGNSPLVSFTSPLLYATEDEEIFDQIKCEKIRIRSFGQRQDRLRLVSRKVDFRADTV